MHNFLDLKGKTALITGASRGIGYHAMNMLAQNNCRIIGTGTSEKSAQHITETLQKFPAGGEGIVMNATDSDSIDQLLARIESDYKYVDILVNNAGIARDALLLRMKKEDWNQVMTVNLTATFLLCQKITHFMLKNKIKGKIINISSAVALGGNVGQSAYAASKAGIIALTKTIAKEFGPKGITANCVAPGFISTDMVDFIPESKINTVIERDTFLKRIGTPDEAAGSILFLASKMSDYITGATINVNGGMYMQ